MGARTQSVAITDGACLLRMTLWWVLKAVLEAISQSGEPWRCCGCMAHSWDSINTCWVQCVTLGLVTLEYFMKVWFLEGVPSNGFGSIESWHRSKRSAAWSSYWFSGSSIAMHVYLYPKLNLKLESTKVACKDTLYGLEARTSWGMIEEQRGAQWMDELLKGLVQVV